MQKTISRRAAFGAIASIPAIGGATASAAVAPSVSPEFPVQRVNRLATELAYAMDDWMADMGENEQWSARVWPASSGRGLYFENHAGEEVRSTAAASQKLLELEAAFRHDLAKFNETFAVRSKADDALFAARPNCPVPPEWPADVTAAYRSLRISEVADRTHPVNVAIHELWQEHEDRVAAWQQEDKAIQRRLGLKKIERANERQLARADRASRRVLNFRAQNLADVMVKLRVHKEWHFNEDEALPIIARDVARIAKGIAAAV